ncbi:MAG: DUF1684 domain-containing protein [Bacteroidota bacterium]
MNKSYLYILVAGVLLIMLAGLWFGMRQEHDRMYEEAIIKYRNEKNVFMLQSNDSPVPDRKNFNGLSYFSPDKKYKFEVKIRASEDTGIYKMRMTDKEEENFQRYGQADFTIEGQKQTLCLFKYLNTKDSAGVKLFLPFTDLTNGAETYAGGRYIDVELKPDSTAVLDFNMAYNPFCVYNHYYVCPVPPKENRLKIRIPAGEREFKP